jgi:hypothetical protein
MRNENLMKVFSD